MPLHGMKAIVVRFALAGLLWTLTTAHAAPQTAAPATDDRPLRALFLGDRGHHKPAERFRQLEPAMSFRGITLVYTERMADLNPATLAGYDALVVYANIVEITPEQEKAVLDFVAGGKGYVPLHCASYCFLKSDKLIALTGAQFKSHGTGIFRTRTAEAGHEVMKDFTSFESWDETYVHHRHNAQERTVLEYRDKEPWTWVRTHGKGRVFYTAWGHDERTWGHVGFQELVERGIRWASGRAVYTHKNEPVRGLKPFQYGPAKDRIPNYVAGAKWGAQNNATSQMQLPLPAAESARHLVLPNGFEAKLFAAEPDIRRPLAMAWDERGRLWVCESINYPNDIRAEGNGSDTIRVCEDTDGDGRADKFTVFAEGLNIPTSLTFWQGGVIVHQAPHTLYLKDTDGDGKADIREKVYSGFGTENQQGMVNSLIFGLDHRIYGSTSVNGGEIRPGNDPAAKPISIKGRDFRFEPVSRQFEPQTGTRQFGMSFDDWGNRFLCSQSEPAVVVVLPLKYLERNPFFTPPATIDRTTPPPTPIHRISPIERWRHLRSSRRVAVAERAVDGAGVSHHVVDAGAGITVYRGGAYPKEYYGNLFLGDSVNNLVHRRVAVPQGGSFKTERVDGNIEFVRSSDIWFRPVNFVNAPDGTLYCLDMAREYSETINIPADVEKFLDLTSGNDKGRIYRIAPDGFRSPPPPQLGRATAAELVAALESPHGWWRDTAHRLIYERQDKSVVPALVKMATQGGSPQSRVHALWSLDGLQALNDGVIAAGLSDAHPGVRENALRLAEPRLDASAELRGKARALVSDPDSHVRMQVAFTIGESRGWNQAELLARVARENISDSWTQSAVLSSAAQCSGELFAQLAGDAGLLTQAAGAEFVRQLVVVIGAQNRPADVARTIEVLAGMKEMRVAFPLVGALGEGLKRAGVSLAAADQRGRLQAVFQRAPQLAVDAGQMEPLRRAAIEVLALVPYGEAAPPLLALMAPTEPPAVQMAAIGTLKKFPDAQVGPALMQRYPGLSPAVRKQIVDALLERTERIDALWSALESRTVRPAELSATQVNALRKHTDERVRQRAGQLLGAANATARQEVYKAFLPALQLAGVPARGQALFEGRCSLCHQYGGRGYEFGPDLGAARSGGKEKLLLSILDPNLEVLAQYYVCSVETKEGESIGGILKNETVTTVTLRQPGGTEKTVPRASIASLKTQSQSFMPEGLEAGLSAQDMADLLAFITNPES